MTATAFLLSLLYVICAFAFVLALVSIYFIIHIWTYRQHKFIRCRVPRLTYNVLWIFFTLLLLCITNALLYNLTVFWKITYFQIVNDSIQYGCTFAYATRAWILFYHVEWSYESVNNIWQTQLAQVKDDTVSKEALDQSIDIEHHKTIQISQFYINYRDSLGNYKKVFPIVMGLILPLFIFLLNVLPLIILGFDTHYDHYSNIILRMVHIVCFLVIFLIILNLIHRIGKISDKYGIGQELKRINICFALFILFDRITNVVLMIVNTNRTNKYNHESQKRNVTFIATVCSVLSILCSLYISSLLVLRRLFGEFSTEHTLRTMESNKTQERLLCIVTLCMNIESKRGKTKEKADSYQVTLNQVLSSKIGFETFTQFLISELSVENILFLVEVKQYKASCRKYHKEEHGMEVTTTRAAPAAPRLVEKPIASLRATTTTKSKPNVFSSKSIMKVDYVPSNTLLQALDPFDYALYLYNKYVIDGSDLQINIPYKTKKQLTKIFVKTDKSDIVLLNDYTIKMFKMYDTAWDQIHTLMKQDSFSRFKDTKEYQDICIAATKQEEKEREETFMVKPKPSILDWNYGEIVIVNTFQNFIPENAEIDMDEEDDNMDDDLDKLNSINTYRMQKAQDSIDIDVYNGMDILNEIDDYHSM